MAQRRAKHISKSKVSETDGIGALGTFRCRFAWQAQGVALLVQSQQHLVVFVSILKSSGRRGDLKGIWKDGFGVAGTVQETCSSEMLGGPGADFFRMVAFWSIRSAGLVN